MTWIGVYEVDITEDDIRPVDLAEGNPSGKTVAYLRNENTGKEYLLMRSSYVIGRDITADIVIADNLYMARKHAVLQKEGEQYYLIDMYSLNGTRINGEKMKPNERYPLSKTAEIEFANEIFRFEIK